MQDLEFVPFYDRLNSLGPLRHLPAIVMRIAVSVCFGLLVLLSRFISVQGGILQDYSWALAALVTGCMLLMYYGTYELQSLIPWLKHQDPSGGFWTVLETRWSARSLLLWGCLIGLGNAAIGYLVFRIPDTGFVAKASHVSGFFLIGFLCGMCCGGLYGVICLFDYLMKQGLLSIDYTHPDGCGGLLLSGETLARLSSITLAMGILLACYVQLFPWVGMTHLGVKIVKVLWLSVPFVAALLVLSPLARMKRVITKYKVEEDRELRAKIKELESRLLSGTDQVESTKALCTQPVESTKAPCAQPVESTKASYAHLVERRHELQRMHTVPQSLASNLKFAGVFISNLAVVWKTLLSVVPK